MGTPDNGDAMGADAAGGNLGGDEGEYGAPVTDGAGMPSDEEAGSDDEFSGILSRLSPKDRESVMAYAKSMVQDSDSGSSAEETMMEKRILLTKGHLRIMAEELMRPDKEAEMNGRRPLNPKHGGKTTPHPFTSPSFAERMDEDSVNITAQAKGNSLSDFSNAAGSSETAADIQKARNAGGDVTLTVNGPETNDSQPQQLVNVGAGESIQSAVSNQANDTIIRNGGSVRITGDGIGK